MIIDRIHVVEALATRGEWPFTVPAVNALIGDGLRFNEPITFLVGENGSGKSTVVEALAEAYGLDVRGGPNQRYGSELPKSALGEVLHVDRGSSGSRMVKRKAVGFFLRAETALDVFERLDRFRTPDFDEASHGESFLAAFERFGEKGVYVLDEPEAALSFTACLSLMGTLQEARAAGSQIVCATHSPILTALPGADILEFGDHGIRRRAWADLDLVQHWRRFLGDPDRYLRYL
jgi:predicted ATPase